MRHKTGLKTVSSWRFTEIKNKIWALGVNSAITTVGQFFLRHHWCIVLLSLSFLLSAFNELDKQQIFRTYTSFCVFWQSLFRGIRERIVYHIMPLKINIHRLIILFWFCFRWPYVSLMVICLFIVIVRTLLINKKPQKKTTAETKKKVQRNAHCVVVFNVY